MTKPPIAEQIVTVADGQQLFSASTVNPDGSPGDLVDGSRNVFHCMFVTDEPDTSYVATFSIEYAGSPIGNARIQSRGSAALAIAFDAPPPANTQFIVNYQRKRVSVTPTP